MKILIAVDMEGISGVVHVAQTDPASPEYARFCRLMTADVNAAVRGAFEGGADEVVVSDGHWDNRNILIEELDSRARLNSGSPRPLSMVEGVDSGVQGAFFVGYHARVGAQNAILDHTWSTNRVAALRLNGELIGEIGMNAAVCGHFDVPLLLVTGDQTACAEGAALAAGLETAVVKQAVGRNAAELLTPEAAHEKIFKAARRAIRRLREGKGPLPYRITPPITVAIDFIRGEMADAAAIMPGARRGADKRVEYDAADMVTAYRAFRSLVGLASL